jgi:hypothetical protein
MDWNIALEVIGLIGGVATLLALFLAPMFYIGSKIDSFRQEVQNDMNEFRKEMKEYHGRLSSIEERNRK